MFMKCVPVCRRNFKSFFFADTLLKFGSLKEKEAENDKNVGKRTKRMERVFHIVG